MPRTILLLGHRGARRYAPENTFPAFDLALEHGADGFEFDVRVTRIRQLVICHNARFNHVSVRRSTLKQLEATCYPDEELPPTLAEVLDRYSRRAFLNIEIKIRGAERLVYRTFRSIPPQHGYLISSFHRSVLRELHRLDPALVLGTISQARWQLRRWESLPCRYLVPNYGLLSRNLVEEAHAAGRLVLTWTVNDAREMLRAADLGVDGIISDDTKLLLQTISR